MMLTVTHKDAILNFSVLFNCSRTANPGPGASAPPDSRPANVNIEHVISTMSAQCSVSFLELCSTSSFFSAAAADLSPFFSNGLSGLLDRTCDFCFYSVTETWNVAKYDTCDKNITKVKLPI